MLGRGLGNGGGMGDFFDSIGREKRVNLLNKFRNKQSDEFSLR
jgi:hypothetical protein